MPRGRVVTTEAAELAVGTVKPRAHGSDPRPHDASDLPVSEAVDISEIHDRAKVFAERLECQLDARVSLAFKGLGFRRLEDRRTKNIIKRLDPGEIAIVRRSR